MGLRVWKTLVVAGFMSLAAQSALAADAYGSFKSFCLDTHGDQSSALLAADAAGWVKSDKTPTSFPMAGTFKLTQLSMRASPDGQMLIVGAGEAAGVGPQPQPATMCMVFGSVDARGFASAGDWVGQPPLMVMNIPMSKANPATTGKMSMYMFNDTPSGRTAIDIAKLKTDGRLNGPVTMLMTMDTSSPMGMLAYMTIKPAP